MTHRCDSTTPRCCTTATSRSCWPHAGTTGDLDAHAAALTALLDADYVHHQLTHRGRTLDELGDAWEGVARKLCGA